MSKKTKVGLIFGGRSAEHEVSLVSAAAVCRNLDPNKYEVISIYIRKEGTWEIVESPLLPDREPARGRARSFLPWGNPGLDQAPAPDIYFPVLHGPYGEDGTIQGLLEMADVPYVGAGVLASAVGMDKASSKALFENKGLPVVPYRVLFEPEWKRERKSLVEGILKELPCPVFVKPSNLGSSVGISKVKSPGDLEAAIELAFGYDRKVIVEEGVEGREFECSVLGNDRPAASLPGEVIPYREFYDYRDKYVDGKTGFVIPAKISASLVSEIQRLAVSAFRAIDGACMARVDFFYAEGPGKLYVNEINTIPGFTEISMYPRLWEASGLPFPALMDRLIELGFERHERKKRCLNWDAS
jgi:D-alanine-D-alanine ligase